MHLLDRAPAGAPQQFQRFPVDVVQHQVGAGQGLVQGDVGDQFQRPLHTTPADEANFHPWYLLAASRTRRLRRLSSSDAYDL
jgi:hypothetical protein